MKNEKFFSYLLVIVSTSLFISCTRENIDYGDTTREAITKVKWSVDYYFAGQDRTTEFSTYQFRFAGNGNVTADDGTSVFNGNWTMITDANRKDVLRINISEAHLQSLNERWTVTLTPNGLTMQGASSEMRLKKL